MKKVLRPAQRETLVAVCLKPSPSSRVVRFTRNRKPSIQMRSFRLFHAESCEYRSNETSVRRDFGKGVGLQTGGATQNWGGGRRSTPPTLMV